MDYLEIEGKAQLGRFGIPINNSILLQDEKVQADISYPCVLKGQILSGKRGKAGAVRVVKSKEELLEAKKRIEEITINNQVMEGVIACEFLPIEEEYYLGMTLDVQNQAMIMLFTPFGGMDIEELAETSPKKLLRYDCTNGFNEAQFRTALTVFELSEKRILQIIAIAKKLSKACFELDATTIEINPLALLQDGTLLAIDAKLVIDDHALYRQGDYTILPRTAQKKSIQEMEAEKYDLTYVEVDPEGTIGTMAGGAGIGMATIDTINYYGGRVNNFLDLGGGVTAEKTYQAMRILLLNQKTDQILVNIFGGINNCADMAEGISRAYRESGTTKKVVIKSRGYNQEQGWRIYEELGFLQTRYGTTDEAVQMLLAKGGREE